MYHLDRWETFLNVMSKPPKYSSYSPSPHTIRGQFSSNIVEQTILCRYNLCGHQNDSEMTAKFKQDFSICFSLIFLKKSLVLDAELY